VFVEPTKANPEDVARKLAIAPDLKLPPPPSWEVGPDGELANYRMQSMGLFRKARNRIAQILYNMFVTYIPFHAVRLGFLGLMGATIGEGSSIMRTTHILDPEFLRMGVNSTIGQRCLIDARAGIWIGDNVTIASDVHIIGGGPSTSTRTSATSRWSVAFPRR
jgi:acetyltransferase-like isoleucine patch superfamily enzyme